MAQPKNIRPRPKDETRSAMLSITANSVDSLITTSRDKKICPGRRQQRHSTEIGSEYHRWWVVRNVLGFETNEHIAGLLLDSFHSVLEQIVSMTGGQVFDPEIHGLESVNCDDPLSASAASPPGFIEDMDEFVHYKSNIGYYCEYLWTLCIQQSRMQPVLQSLSPPIQQFLIRLIGYIRTAKAKSQTPSNRRKRSKNPFSKQADHTDKSKADYPTSPQRGRDGFHSNSKVDACSNSEDPNNQKTQTRDGPYNWNFNSNGQSVKAEDLVDLPQSLKQTQQLLSDTGSAASNTSFDTEPKFENGKQDKMFNGLSSQYWDNLPSCKANSKRDGDQFEPWNSQRDIYPRAKVELAEPRHQKAEKQYKHKIYDNNKVKKDWKSSPEIKDDKDLDWPRFHAANIIDTAKDMSCTSAPNSCPSSVPSTPHVYLDCDIDQTMEDVSSLEDLPPVTDDHCLKSLLSKPLKVQSVDTPQFVKEDGTLWHSFHGSQKDTDREGNLAGTLDLVEKKLSCSEEMLNPSKSVEDPQLALTDLKFRPDLKSLGNTSHTSSANNTNTTNHFRSGPAEMSSTPPTLVYAGPTNGQTHPLGTPVFLYPAGGFPASDNSLASLPALVQNIVYNQSGPPLMQPIAERPCTPANSNAFSSAVPMINRGPCIDASTPPGFMPLYMPGQPRVNTGYNKSSHLVSSSSGILPGNMSVLSSTSKKVTSCEIRKGVLNDLPSTTRLYQEWTTASGYQLLSSLGTKEPATSRSPQFQITDVRSCEDTDFSKNSSQCGSTKHSADSHGVWPQDNKNLAHQDKSVLSDVQGLSGRKLNIVSDLRDSTTPSKNTSHAGRHGNQHSQVGLSGSRQSATRAVYGNNSKYTSISHSNSKQSSNGHRNSKFTPLSHIKDCHKVTIHSSGRINYMEGGPTTLNKHIVSSMDSFSKAKPSKSEQPQKQPKKQISSANVRELSDSTSKEITRAKSSSGSGFDSSKMACNEDQVSEQCRQLKEQPDLSHSDQRAKKIMQVSKPRTAAAQGPPSQRTSSRRHTCQSCELVFPSGTDLLLHRYELHSLVCGECDSRFLSSSGLLRHKETDHPPINRCPHCRFVTFSRDELASHIESEHSTSSGEKSKNSMLPRKDLDNKETTSDSSLRIHQERKRDGLVDSVNSTMLGSCRDEQTSSLTSSAQDKAWPTPGNNSSSSCQGQFLSCSDLDRNVTSEQITNFENPSSESEDTCLVIDAPENFGHNEKASEIVTPSSEEEPLCLVVHTRESDRTEKPITLVDHQENSVPEEQIIPIKQFEMKESGLDKTNPKSLRSRDVKECTGTSVFSELESQQSSSGGKDCRLSAKRKVSSSTERSAADSSACFTYHEHSLESMDRDSWSTGQLDGSGDGQTLTKTDLISRSSSSCLRLKSNLHGCGSSKGQPHKPKRTRSVSASSNADVRSILPAVSASDHSKSREMALQDRHTLSSLPPKKRGFRKSPRHTNFNTSGNTKTLRDGSGSERVTEVCQSQNSTPESNSEVEESPNASCSGDTGRDLEDKAAVNADSETRLIIATSPALKVLRKKTILSKSASQRQGQNKHKHQSFESSMLNRKNLRSNGDQAEVNKTSCTTASEPIKNHKCPAPGCGASFSRKWTMKVHIDRVHVKDSRHLTCHVPMCLRKFSSRRELRKHVVEGHQGKVRRYTCSWPNCGQGFFTRTHLRTHTLVHTGEKPIACQLCDYRCRQRTALIWHMRKHGNSSGHQQESTKNSNTDS